MASFVDPKRVPQMAGAEEVVAAVGPCPGPVRAGLALNERGYERLLATGLDEVRFAFGITESFNQRNQGSGVEDSIVAARRIASRARGDGVRCSVTFSVAFGCPFEGEVDPDRVLEIAEQVAEVEPDCLILADTIGVASPSAVRSLDGPRRRAGAARGRPLPQHAQHGYANALAALDAGATVLDASVGGLGGVRSHRTRREHRDRGPRLRPRDARASRPTSTSTA